MSQRVAFRANEGYARRDGTGSIRYHVAKITENEPGWLSYGSYVKVENAVEQAKFLNRVHGISEKDALDIELSSMRASGAFQG